MNVSLLHAKDESQKIVEPWWEKLEEKPFAVSDKDFTLDKKLLLSFGLGTILNSSFQSVFFYQLGLAFFWNERLGVEYSFINYSNANNAEVDNIRLISGIPFLERQRRSHSIYLLYAPIYGKIDAFGKLFHIRVYGGLGPSYLGLEDNLNSFNGVAFQETFRSYNKVGLTTKLGVKTHLSHLLQFNLELLTFHHFSNEIAGVKEKNLLNLIYVQAGMSLSF